ncbi:fumarylacetoacetate hydrolase family protein [Peribacillus simplex]|uniref:Fumarylacetoacetate hydrolase family protein n=2 Tax=Peribacillus TaxID=2675229 RepID=A0AA90T5L5_9BACI|nr:MULTISPECIES: fumarylacetoacetate hydrolase family protein [Peribacillus]MDP1418738.1 fumarylacetoacetate hydrolase family protein [Peribacillus simplex]MDP1450792.1 fumarylacetoacetate hydrolase family protein [Peribacillus frigoritolerans]
MAKARVKLQKSDYSEEMEILSNRYILMNGDKYEVSQVKLDNPISGTVYGTLLNYKGSLEALKGKIDHPPYNEPPKGPILYIKPRNTFSSFSNPVPLPTGIPELEIGAALAIVISKTATRVKKEHALDYIEGFTIANDISIPHESVFRPAIRQKARDGFCPIGPWVVSKESISNPDSLGIRVYINGELRQENSTSNLIRSISRLIEDVTDFMTLSTGDVLLAGVPENAPLAKANDHVRIEIDDIGYLENTIISEEKLSLEGIL